ncbi:MAG: MarR family transcriptional regulator [Gammaproteobacteria bacterium]|nr:MarR family transcriptional regulator [Gammaproteobacteria bacterium]
MSFDHLHLDRQLCHRLYVLSNATTRVYRPLLDKLGITYPQYIVMMALWQHNDENQTQNLDIKQLKEKTSIDAGALSLILKKLQDKELVQITPSQQDKRVKFVSLSTKGNSLKQQASDIPQALRCKIPSLNDSELIQFRELMDKIMLDLNRPS